MARERRITVHLIDGTERDMVISKIKYDTTNDCTPVVARFGRDDGNGWVEFLAAPLTSIIYWD
jgi:hypothetical protein